jgi:hypothetical protein
VKEETFCPNAKLWDWLCFCHYLSFIFYGSPSLYPFPLRAVLASYKNFPIKFWAKLFLWPPVRFIQSPPLNSTIGGNHTYKQLKVLVLTETYNFFWRNDFNIRLEFTEASTQSFSFSEIFVCWASKSYNI